MARARAQSAAHQAPAPDDQGILFHTAPDDITRQQSTGNRPHGVQPRQEPPAPKHTESHRPSPSPTREKLSRQDVPNKRAIEDVIESSPSPAQKRPRISPARPAEISGGPATGIGAAQHATDRIAFWVDTGHWPAVPECVLRMERAFARKRLSRKRSNPFIAPTTTTYATTPSDQKPRELKSVPYQTRRYETLLATRGSFLSECEMDITNESKTLCHTLLGREQTTPQGSLFDDNIFQSICRVVRARNEQRVLRDITPLIAPSAEILAVRGATQLGCLVECLNEGWNNSIPLTGTRPQPDYSVGFRRKAFTEDQLAKLSPFIGDFIDGDQSFFMATYFMYFPFLTCEVKCGDGALDVADRQNAHSMSLAVRAIVELFRLVHREGEVNRQILAFSISHNHDSVRIYGHYSVIDGEHQQFYRHPIRNFSFTELDGREKWAAYRFTKNVFDVWMPEHFQRICSAIDKLSSEQDSGVAGG